jgi:uncharacterized damage-inducible protein DinB
MTKDELIDALTRSFNGEAWHGPAVADVLADVTAEEALYRPAKHVHSIWEITLHIAAWAGEVASRLRGQPPGEPEDGDWREARGLDNDAWEEAIQEVFSARDELIAAIREQSDADLAIMIGSHPEPALATGFSRAASVLGVIQHNAYHGGQIAVLKKEIRATA